MPEVHAVCKRRDLTVIWFNVKIFTQYSFVHMKSLLITWWKYALAGLVVLSLFGLGAYRITRNDAAASTERSPRAVLVESIESLSGDGASLPAVGIVQSRSEAELRTESAGRVTRLSYELGDRIAAGAVLAELENASQRAALMQAQGALESAQAAAQKTESGARMEDETLARISVTNAEMALEEERVSAVNAIRSAYATNDDLVHTKLDAMFLNPRTGDPLFQPLTSDAALTARIEADRPQFEDLLAAEASRGAKLEPADDLKAELERARGDAERLQQFINDIADALNRAIATDNVPQDTLAGYTALASAARTSIATSLASLTGARKGLTAKETQLATARTSEEEVLAGARPEDVSGAQAAIKQAQGAYNAALASLEKTIIRAPISGTINSLGIELGDYVTAFQLAAVVSNNAALEVVATVSEDDRSSISPGDAALIQGTYEGVVSRVAAAIDPQTGKVEVRIALPDEALSHLTNGQSVQVALHPSRESEQSIRVPISAVKLGAEGAFLFTVNDDHTLRAHPVVLGELSGESVEIESGATFDMKIVVDARGLTEGDTVSLQSQ